MSWFGSREAEPAEVEICFNRKQKNLTVDPFCGKTLGFFPAQVAFTMLSQCHW